MTSAGLNGSFDASSRDDCFVHSNTTISKWTRRFFSARRMVRRPAPGRPTWCHARPSRTRGAHPSSWSPTRPRAWPRPCWILSRSGWSLVGRRARVGVGEGMRPRPAPFAVSQHKRGRPGSKAEGRTVTVAADGADLAPGHAGQCGSAPRTMSARSLRYAEKGCARAPRGQVIQPAVASAGARLSHRSPYDIWTSQLPFGR